MAAQTVSSITQEKIRQVAAKIARDYKPERIILFGSHAWGKPHPDSDIDLFMVKRTNDSTIQRHRKVGRLLFGNDFPIDVLIYTPNQVKRRLAMQDFFVQDILSKGITLYEKQKNKRIS